MNGISFNDCFDLGRFISGIAYNIALIFTISTHLGDSIVIIAVRLILYPEFLFPPGNIYVSHPFVSMLFPFIAVSKYHIWIFRTSSVLYIDLHSFFLFLLT